MAVRDHVTRIAKLRTKIVTVDPSQRLIEAVTAEGGTPRRLTINDVPAGFQWPVEGEEWSIYEENGYWRLGNKFLNSEETNTFNGLAPGDTYIEDTFFSQLASMMAPALASNSGWIDQLRLLIAYTGEVRVTASSTVPTGWLVCDGSAVSRTTYATLFASIGTTYGVGDGSTTFNLPDMRGRVPVGLGTHANHNALGKSDALAVASRTTDHTHTTPSHTHGPGTLSVAAHSHFHVSPIGMNNGRAVIWNQADGGLDLYGAYNYSDVLNAAAWDTGVSAAGATLERHYVTSSATAPSVNGGATAASGVLTSSTTGPAYLTLSYIIKT